MTPLEIAVAMYIAYLVGSFSSAIIVCRLMGLPDPRIQGSRNPGATNVLRIGGKRAALITLLGDVLKGFIPVVIAKWYGFNGYALALIALSAFLGHLFPIFFRFEGGKGVATAIGCVLALSWPAGLCWLGTWMVIAALFRFSSLASLTASLLAPAYIWIFTRNWSVTLIIAVMSFILILRHWENIVRLVKGKESRLGSKKFSKNLSETE